MLACEEVCHHYWSLGVCLTVNPNLGFIAATGTVLWNSAQNFKKYADFNSMNK